MRKIIFSLAALGLVLASCSKEETTGVNSKNPDGIQFNAATSRAAINVLANVKGGFRVYGTSGATPTGWYSGIDGTNVYKYTTAWGWAGTTPQWPTAQGTYPMNFYAMYPDAAPSAVTAGTKLESEITIPAVASQVDMLSAKATAASKPMGGALAMTFKHILSKVNFGVIAGEGMIPEIQAVVVKNVHDKNTYNYMAQTWGASTSGNSGLASYDYFRNTTAPKSFTVGSAAEDVTSAQTFYLATDNKNLMLMPQVATGETGATGAPVAWAPVGGTAPTNTVAYIEVIYRITKSSNNVIGYEDGSDYLTDWNVTNTDITFENAWETKYPNGLGSSTGQYNGHLYIRVGFPVTLSWVPGKGYVYNLCLGTRGSTGGYYIDDTYYDENGDDTGIDIVGPDQDGDGDPDPVDPGKPVFDGDINFIPGVEDWDDTTPTPLG